MILYLAVMGLMFYALYELACKPKLSVVGAIGSVLLGLGLARYVCGNG